MRLTHLLNSRIIVARMASISGDKMAFSTVTSVMSHIQPMDRSKGEIAEGVFAKTYRIYTDGDVDIEDGDRLRDLNGNYYTIVADGVSRRTFGSFDYCILIVEKTK